ncbi:MAG: hypothetical protein AUJ18_08475 [Candidatus Hydrogenedentes bacterium CG1_02_42_14]|nr:MAG: hypothetical protein AUJ18_08475 [Candidatus Hydrogenedentes bacterium CG1_02_42_14]
MKGFTHFMSGVAAATCVPEIVRMSTASRLDTVEGAASSLIILLPGIFGILPDTMDFKLGQFFSPGDVIVDPDPINTDPQKMAESFAEAVRRTGETGKPCKIQFYPIQLGGNLWRQYSLIFDEWEVKVQINEIVKTSQTPIPGTALKQNRLGVAKLPFPLKARTNEIDWMNSSIRKLRHLLKGPDAPPGPVKPSTLDILSGTQFEMKLENDGKIFFNWLPWHRTWSHSYVLGILLSLPVFLIAFLSGLYNWWIYGLAAILGFTVHITEDMTGHIGGSLLWPIHKTRSEGFEMFKASDPRTNFSINYTAILLILWNVDMYSIQIIPIPWWQYWTTFWLVPLGIYFWFVGKKKQELRLQDKMEQQEEPDGTGDLVVD